MSMTIILGIAAGFAGGNGLPYFVAGSTGDGRNPAPFGDSAAANVVIGCGMFLVSAVCWHFAHAAAHPLAGYAAGAVGVLAVGLIHARTWRHNPWPWRRTS